MLLLSALIGILSAGLGHLGAIAVPPWFGFESTTTSGMMACAAGLLFCATWIFSPRHGLLTRLYRSKEEEADA
jgi:manganese/zinc/iron transport system permease protein